MSSPQNNEKKQLVSHSKQREKYLCSSQNCMKILVFLPKLRENYFPPPNTMRNQLDSFKKLRENIAAMPHCVIRFRKQKSNIDKLSLTMTTS